MKAAAAVALARIGAPPTEIVPMIIKQLSETNAASGRSLGVGNPAANFAAHMEYQNLMHSVWALDA